jgi:hypothetical protein
MLAKKHARSCGLDAATTISSGGAVMLGDKLGEESGKVVGQRVLPGEGGRYVKMEITFEGKGKILGQSMTDTGTYVAYERIPGQIFGEGQGIIMTENGEGAIWSGFGVGQPTGEGMGIKWRAALNIQTNGEKLARLNNVLVLAEFETDDQGNTRAETWEWK